MTKYNNKGRSNGGAKHVRLYAWLLKSAAWRSLKPGPKALLIELYSRYNGDNNGDLFLSEREAANKCNISKMTARKYFRELEEKGFIRSKIKGSFNVKQPTATVWILTEYEHNQKPPTKDFMKYVQPEKQNTGLKFIPGGTKIYTRTPQNVAQIPPNGTKIYTR